MSHLQNILFSSEFPAFDAQFNSETGEHTLQVDLPGVKKEDLSIKTDHSRLTVVAKRETQSENDELRIARKGRWKTKEFAFELSDKFDLSAVKAQYVNGVLNLSIKPKEQSRPKEIDIQFE